MNQNARRRIRGAGKQEHLFSVEEQEYLAARMESEDANAKLHWFVQQMEAMRDARVVSKVYFDEKGFAGVETWET